MKTDDTEEGQVEEDSDQTSEITVEDQLGHQMKNKVIQKEDLITLINNIQYKDILRVSSANESLYKDLNRYWYNWEKLEDKYAFQNIMEGITFEIDKLKINEFFNNLEIRTQNSSVKKEDRQLLNGYIKEYLEKGLIEEVGNNEKIFNSNVFFVHSEKRTTKSRLILNMKKLNKFVSKRNFTMLKVNEIFNYINKGAYATVIDISKAYYHIKINEKFQNFFAFTFNDKKFKFKVLPFGFTNAPYIFTKITEPIWKYLRKNFNIMIFAYLDDILIISESEDECKIHATQTLALLALLGFNINKEKLIINPTRKFTYLGVVIDTINMTVENTIENIDKCKVKIEDILRSKVITLRKMESILGLLNFMSNFIEDGRRYLIPLIKIINKMYHINRDTEMVKEKEVDIILERWTLEENYIPKKLLPQLITVTIRTDASKTKWGATVESNIGSNQISDTWKGEEIGLNINNKELLAVRNAINHFKDLIKNQHLSIHVDNRTAVACLKKRGTHKNKFRDRIVQEILNILISKNSTMEIHHIPGKQNILADLLSRSDHIIPSELQISKELFWKISIEFGMIPEIDLFATPYSNKCIHFTSSIPDKKAISLNAFTINWGSYSVLYAFPPPTLISKVLYKWKREKKGSLLLIAPAWPSKIWYPILMKMKVKEWILPIKEKDFYLKTIQGISYINVKKFHLTGYIL